MHGWKDFSPLHKSASVEVLSQRVKDVAPKLRLRAGWGVNELIKEHALDSDAPKAGNSFFLSLSNINQVPSFGLPWRSDRSFCVCAWNRGEGCRIALWDCLWTNLDPVSISTFQQPKEKYYSRCWNPPSPVTQFTLFLSLPPSLTFCGPPLPSFARFCLIHAFLVLECRTRTVRNFYKFLIKQLESFTHHCVL